MEIQLSMIKLGHNRNIEHLSYDVAQYAVSTIPYRIILIEFVTFEKINILKKNKINSSQMYIRECE